MFAPPIEPHTKKGEPMKICLHCALRIAEAKSFWWRDGRWYAQYHDPIPGSTLTTTREVEMPEGWAPPNLEVEQ